jgi:hypothetical protein
MNELSDAPEQGGAEESAQVEDTAEATAAQDTGTEETGQADDTGEATEEPAKRVPWFQKRIDEVTRQKYDAQREADYWRGLAEGRSQPRQPQQQQVSVPDRWEDPEGYDRWLISQAAEVARRQTAQDMQRQQVLRTYEERVQATRQSHPDYDAVVHDPSLPITPLMAEVIREREAGPEVAYYLGTNRSEAQRIAALSLHQQAAELGRIEAAFAKAPQAQPRTPPSAPPRTVSGLSAGLNKDPNDMSMAEYVAARKAGRL